MLTAEMLAELERLHAKATPGPWHTEVSSENREQSVHGPQEEHHDPDGTVMFTAIGETCYDYAWSRTEANYALIAAMRNALPALLAAARDGIGLRDVHPRDEWGEDDGPVLWWRFPVVEPPYAGTILDDDFPEYVTHWTRIPVPAALTASSGEGSRCKECGGSGEVVSFDLSSSDHVTCRACDGTGTTPAKDEANGPKD